MAAGFKARAGALAIATVTHRLAVLSKADVLKEAQNPRANPAVRELVACARRAYAARGVRAKAKPAMVREPLEVLLTTCDDSLRGVRDRAPILFAWASGGRRRSEVADATIESLERTGQSAFAYRLGRSKTNQAGIDRPDDARPVVDRAGEALQTWITRAGIRAGPHFRRIGRGERILGGLSHSAIRRTVKARCDAAGLGGNFSAHSLRSGFVTEASVQGVEIPDIMAMTGHASVATMMRYHRRALGQQNPAARLLGTTATEPATQASPATLPDAT